MRDADYTSPDGSVRMWCGDCLELLPEFEVGSVDAVVTDPPYPDQYADEYGYDAEAVRVLDLFPCRQMVFWSAKSPLPLDCTAVHIWDKVVGCASTYERILERNGHANYLIWRALLLSSEVQAMIMGDEFTIHPSQKPTQLLRKLVLHVSHSGSSVLDPFMGSGTTGVACVKTGRKFYGIEKEPKYFEIAVKRIERAFEDQGLFVPHTPQVNGQLFEEVAGV